MATLDDALSLATELYNELEVDDLEMLSEGAYCVGCGQIGCHHG